MLIIDDEELMRIMLIELFHANGIDAVGAANGVDGLKKLKDNNFDLVLTDIVMPDKEGVETIKEIKSSYPNIKIVAMSGGGRLNGVDYLELASALGADKTFQKPFDRKIIVEEIKALLSL